GGGAFEAEALERGVEEEARWFADGLRRDTGRRRQGGRDGAVAWHHPAAFDGHAGVEVESQQLAASVEHVKGGSQVPVAKLGIAADDHQFGGVLVSGGGGDLGNGLGDFPPSEHEYQRVGGEQWVY